MELAFAVFKYFPYGGLQKDMLAIARQCLERGHGVTIYCREWQGDKVDGVKVHVLPSGGLSNHVRDRRFVQQLRHRLSTVEYDGLVGFNKMPGLDVYYAADSCYRAKVLEERSVLSRLGSRFALYGEYEASVFAGNTHVLMISPRETEVFQRYYSTPQSCFHLLPPGIRRDRIAPPDYAAQRAAFRQQWSLAAEDKLVLAIGSGFRTKGLDRSITALAALPPGQRACTHLFVIGQDKVEPYVRQAQRLGVADRVQWLAGRDDIPQFLWGADLLIHPARRENTGTVLLEAMVAGLPVLTTDACGYAPYVVSNDMGRVLDLPFVQSTLNAALASMLTEPGETWRQRGRDFSQRADIYDMPARAAQLIEILAVNRAH